ncbi:MAG: hypothetical protein MZV70_39310 [Desulfobacterales bacterium]|nr:hypothetical protein [Desulfobacterales bacterium]
MSPRMHWRSSPIVTVCETLNGAICADVGWQTPLIVNTTSMVLDKRP